MPLDAKDVTSILLDCLFQAEEILPGNKPPENAIFVEGLTMKFGLHPDRLESHRAEVVAMLAELPDDFSEGVSFAVLCNDRHGRQWTGLHRTMEALVVLGLGLGLVAYCAPRDMWPLMYGGLPYVQLVGSQAQPVVLQGEAPELEDQI